MGQPHNQQGWDNVKHMGNDVKDALLNVNYAQLRAELEGPKPLRAIAGCAGAAMAITAALGLLNIFSILSSPARFVLQMYEVAFGLVIVTTELKDVPCSAKFKDFYYQYFPFLTVVGGKGAYMIMAGSLGCGFTFHNLLLFIPSAVVTVLGFIYVLIHFSKCKVMEEKYDRALEISVQQSGYA